MILKFFLKGLLVVFGTDSVLFELSQIIPREELNAEVHFDRDW